MDAHNKGKIEVKRTWPMVLAYAAAGMLLGIGAPAGSLFFKYLVQHAGEIRSWVASEWSGAKWFYVYMSISAVLVFTVAALIAARIHVGLKQNAAALSEKARRSEEKAARDPLTGLYQFHYIRERLAIEIERSKRYQTPLSCLMIDVDKLKAINDTLGHAAGDLILKKIAEVFQRMVRVIDTATRYAGDEFLIILPVTNAQGALLAGERLRRAVEKEEILYKGQTLKAEISVGVGAYPSEKVHDLNSLLEVADQNLYAAKKNGRNCTIGMFVKPVAS